MALCYAYDNYAANMLIYDDAAVTSEEIELEEGTNRKSVSDIEEIHHENSWIWIGKRLQVRSLNAIILDLTNMGMVLTQIICQLFHQEHDESKSVSFQ